MRGKERERERGEVEAADTEREMDRFCCHKSRSTKNRFIVAGFVESD